MFRFPRTISPRRRLICGCLGVLGVLVAWWFLTLPLIPQSSERREVVETGEVELRTNPVTGESIEVKKRETVVTVVEIHRALVRPPALDTPGNTFRSAMKLFRREPGSNDPTLWDHLLKSTLRILLGFALSTVIAVPLGIMMGLFPHLRAAVMPIISFLRPLPSIAWVPLAMIWLGVDEVQKLAIIFMGTFAAALIYTIEATIKVEPDLIKAAQNLGCSDRQLLWRVLLPAALPNILSGLKVVMAIGWTCVISAEIVGTREGLGALIWLSQETSNTAAVLVGMAGISGIVLLLDLLITRVERWVLPYLHLEEAR